MNEINNDLFDIYSGLYRDVNGFRPQGLQAKNFMALSQEEAGKVLKELDEQLEQVMIYEQEELLQATFRFLEAMKSEGSMSKAIIEEIKKSDNDPEYVDYNWGMKYGTTRHLAGYLISQVKEG